MADYTDALDYHFKGRRGKLEVVPTKPLSTQRHLSLAYTPGVASACTAIHDHPPDVFKYTAKGNLVAVVTNGTAVLGLGNIGPEASKPVMEGKANLFKKFADIDVFDIELDAQTVDEIVAAVKAIAPTFGGINLEDIRSPECFEVERILQEELDIPVFHDDQHGTAIISAAALLNGIQLTQRDISRTQIVFSGAGAAALACASLYVALGVQRQHIVMVDSKGVIRADRDQLSPQKAAFATTRTLDTLGNALLDADVFVGLSAGGLLSEHDIRGMAPKPLIFAMANPNPEIPYATAKAARPDAIVATGRSDYPNQVNNVLGFPFVFRGALDCRARKITEEMKVAATRAIAKLAHDDVPDEVLRAYGIEHLAFGPEYIIPKPFDSRVLLWVAPAVAEAAHTSGVARAPIHDLEAYRESLHRLVQRSRGLMQPLIRRARANSRRRVVFPDGEHASVLRATQRLLDEGICTPVLLGNEQRILTRASALHMDLQGVECAEVGGALLNELADQFWQQRQRKGVTQESARALLKSPLYFGAMMVREKLADGLVGGAGRPYKHTLRPALQILGLRPNAQVVSGVYAMLQKDRKLFFGDCTVNVKPDATLLAEIALNTARVAETFGETPRVAMLSYSDFGEHRKHDGVRQVRQAIDLVRQRRPDLEIDGEMQADTAVNEEKLKERYPFSVLTGPPNVLVFPDLASGNIAYKLLENLSGTEALGPLLVGVGGAVNVIPLHAAVSDIVNIAAYTVNQALDIEVHVPRR